MLTQVKHDKETEFLSATRYMLDPIITKYLLSTGIPYASIFCSGKATPSDQCPELAYSPDRKFPLVSNGETNSSSLVRIAKQDFLLGCFIDLASPTERHRYHSQNGDERRWIPGREIQLKFVNPSRSTGTDCLLAQWILEARQLIAFIHFENVRVKQWNLINRSYLILR